MTRSEMDRVWTTVQRISVPLFTALILGVGGMLFALRDDLHAQDTRLVALERTVPTMEMIERRFTAILIEVSDIKGDLRVIRTRIDTIAAKICELEERVVDLEKREHGGK